MKQPSIPIEPHEYVLGTHTVETTPNQHITLMDDTTLMSLDNEEAYKLLLVLQELFQ